MGGEKEKDVIEKLRSTNTSDVYDALVKIRKNYVGRYAKNKNFQNYSFVQKIIPFLEHPKFCVISMSIIADGCNELDFVKEVIKYNGINSLMRIMKSFINDEIQNKACRAIGNIAKFEIGYKAIHLTKPISYIINFLSDTSNVVHQQTAIRTLMYLAKSTKTKELITQGNGIVCIAKLLHSSNVQVLISCTKALATLTQNCSLSCAQQLLELKYLKVLVELHSHSEKTVQNHALISLKNLSLHEEIRSDLVKVGAVKLFTEILSAHESLEMSRQAALALCRCLDHIHMWSHNGTEKDVGLKALLAVLQDKQFQNIHKYMIEALIPFTYESKITDILLNLEILQILTQILKDFIEKHKCKSVVKPACKLYTYERDDFTLDLKKNEEFQTKEFSSEFQLSSTKKSLKHIVKSTVEISKDIRENSSYDGNKKPLIMPNKQDICLLKPVSKWGHSKHSFSSKTSDYSGSCSPNSSCSPVRKFSTSPETGYDTDVGSPSTGHASSGIWSPNSVMEENTLHYVNCWSPVVSTHSDSLTTENDLIDSEDNDNLDLSSVNNVASDIDDTDILDANIDSFVYCNSSLSHELYSTYEEEKLSGFQSKNKYEEHFPECSEDQASKKKLKTEEISKEGINFQPSSTDDKNTTDSDTKGDMDENRKSLNCKQSSVTFKSETIDHYIIHFILQLSFHIKKKTNSQIADKTCFSVLIDYLCFIHNPSPKAEDVLFHLMKNRYCFEKLILSGFISELEEKMISPNYLCIHRSRIKETYSNLIYIGQQEAESDYGIGTLSHILVTSEKIGQLHAISAMSKLVTEKVALFKLLFQAKGLSLLFDFLSDSNVLTRRKAITSLCELYQSLTKEQKPEKCCFEGTCGMKTSSNCSYKESFLNVTFTVSGGAKILANREKICENSDYFSALLKGHFLETNAELVSLPCISAENLSTIFHFLHGCGSGNCCPYIKRIPFSVLLELLSDCEKFLLMNIKAFVEDRLCHRLFPSTVPNIYRQSKIHNSPELTKKTLDFALKMDLLEKDQLWNCFEELINSQSNLSILDDIKILMESIF